MSEARGKKRASDIRRRPETEHRNVGSIERLSKSISSSSRSGSMERNPLRDHSDVLRNLIPFNTEEGYLFIAGVSKHWKAAWGDRPKKTHLKIAVQSVSCLSWSKDSGCRWDVTICERAAFRGSLEAVRYARSHSCPWDVGTCINAAQGGHLEVLMWCRANGCPWELKRASASQGDIYRCSSATEPSAGIGTRTHASKPLGSSTSRCCNG